VFLLCRDKAMSEDAQADAFPPSGERCPKDSRCSRTARHSGPCNRYRPSVSAAAAKEDSPRQAPMSEGEAQALADAESLQLLRSSSMTGFKGVQRCSTSKFLATIASGDSEDGQKMVIGTFDSAPEAALAYSRHLGAGWFSLHRMSEAEVHRLAEAEGLKLVPSDNATGYKAVTQTAASKRSGSVCLNPFTVNVKRQGYNGGKNSSLGMFPSAHEAALAYARFLGPELSNRVADAASSQSSQSATPTGEHRCPKDARCSRPARHPGLCKLYWPSTSAAAAKEDAPRRTHVRDGRVISYDMSTVSAQNALRIVQTGIYAHKRGRRPPHVSVTGYGEQSMVGYARRQAADNDRHLATRQRIDDDSGHCDDGELQMVLAVAVDNDNDDDNELEVVEALLMDPTHDGNGGRFSSRHGGQAAAASASHAEEAAAMLKAHAEAAALAVAAAEG